MRIILGSRLFTRGEFKDEEELETVVQTRPEVILNEDVMFISKKSLRTPGGAETVPEAIAVDLSTERWYVIEVELAAHGVWNHIANQVSKQIVAASNPKMRLELRRIVMKEIEATEKWRKKLTDRGVPEMRMQEVVENILAKEPVIVIPIDRIPSDLNEWANTQKHQVESIPVEKYVEVGSNEVAYHIRGQLVASPEPPTEEKVAERHVVTEEEFLKQCDKPGQILYQRLKKLAAEKKHEFRPSTQSFSYYVVWRGGKFCPLIIWPKGVTIMRWNINDRNGVTPQSVSSFRDEIMRISDLANRYDAMPMPGLSTREGDLSENEIDDLMAAFRKLVDSVEH